MKGNQTKLNKALQLLPSEVDKHIKHIDFILLPLHKTRLNGQVACYIPKGSMDIIKHDTIGIDNNTIEEITVIETAKYILHEIGHYIYLNLNKENKQRIQKFISISEENKTEIKELSAFIMKEYSHKKYSDLWYNEMYSYILQNKIR